MIKFDTIIYQFAEQGEKTGWSYIIIPQDLALELKPGNKKSFRVKGFLDHFPIAGVALMPWGDGSFIMAINADMRKGIHKSKGATIAVQLETHDDYVVEMPEDLQECFDCEQPEALEFFNSLPRGHRDYFIKWINSAKTEPTRATRIANTINAAARRMGYSEMIRDLKAKKDI
ncbi:YdeI/OmpD-associated family protein [Mucilaginibacter jinjuensis]|uniref:YdeI/OmpD-associated family protein n=1 Tax=Mucilaginibacter jinjuensis TaxID=1176721 RepID=A0ABY7T5E4_9SPHI|nr:YdeI/OmpD-associated family protein [Mucilaginibacter jinjuensis]WCT11395.1 YdeI/OmpD-associated family protein [Mucilaginibacter jinjuensis]